MPDTFYSIICRKCGKTLRQKFTEKELAHWRMGMPIQDAMPNVKPEIREMLITGYCNSCFKGFINEEDIKGCS